MGDTAKSSSKTGLALAVILLCLFLLVVFTFRTSFIPPLDQLLFSDISFDAHGGSIEGAQADSQRVWAWEPVSVPQAHKDGYVLLGWVDSASGAVTGPGGGRVGGSGTLRAVWARDRYAISYDLACGSLEGRPPTSYSIASDVVKLPEPFRYAYEFQGWRIDGCEGLVDSIDPMLARDVTAHAVWTPAVDAAPATLYLGDELDAVSYSYCYGWDTAPAQEAGIWQGIGCVTDGDPTYYIGHNPGIFAQVADFHVGSLFAVCDDAGNLGCYRVVRIVTVLHDGTIFTPELQAMVMPQGEYATLQTCRLDNVYMDIFVGKRIDK